MTKHYYRVPVSTCFRSARITLLLFIVTLLTPQILAGTRAVNLAEMTTRAGRIVHGRVVEVREGLHPKNEHMAVTFVTVQVTEMLKGEAARAVTFMQYGNSTHQYIVHMPKYAVGEEVVLFLYPESKLGFTSPIGEGQGKFLVRDDVRTGTRTLLNEQLNRTVLTGLDGAKMTAKLALTRTERDLVNLSESDAGKKLEFSAFRSIVRKIAANPKAIEQ